jgi:hypothetical protein
VLTVIVSSLLAGYELSASGRRNWLYTASYIIVLSVALGVIIDYEYPRLGFARITSFDRSLEDLLPKMK